MQLKINAAPITINPPTLPDGTQGTPYDVTLIPSGGAGAPYTFSNPDPQDLPAGIGMTPGGEIKGVPTSSGVSNFTVRVSDAAGNTADF